MNKLFLLLILAPTLLCTTRTFAQIAINQSSISSFPYVISNSGSYILTSNITVSTVGYTAIQINAADVTLDLNGYTINGGNVCTNSSCANGNYAVGVNSSQPGTVIQNGFIKGFLIGTYVSMGRVRDLVVSSCAIGIEANQSTIQHNTVISCDSAGIEAFYSALTDNVTNGNSSGIYVFDSSVTNNTSYNNTSYGLFIDNGVALGNALLSNGTDLWLSSATVTNKSNGCSVGAC